MLGPQLESQALPCSPQTGALLVEHSNLDYLKVSERFPETKNVSKECETSNETSIQRNLGIDIYKKNLLVVMRDKLCNVLRKKGNVG